MTLEEFLRSLATNTRGWQLVPGGAIRRMVRDSQGSCDCPLTAVALAETGRPYHLGDWLSAAMALGLALGDAVAIADASDEESQDNRALRASLLLACGHTDRQRTGRGVENDPQ